MAVLEVFAHNASAVVSVGGNTTPSPGTPETWTVAGGSTLPAATTGVTQFHVADPALPSELVKVESETWVRVLSAKLQDGREVTVPRANVELIEG